MNKNLRIRELINRLARLDTMQAWDGDLNPTQTAVLEYLGRANRFSRSPSQVANYLGSTRGTISQSLKSLGQKGYVVEQRSSADKRTIRFDLTDKGQDVAQTSNFVVKAITELDEQTSIDLSKSLEGLLAQLLKQNEGRPFGVCKECVHFSAKRGAGYCTLLSQALTKVETTQICHEQVAL